MARARASYRCWRRLAIAKRSEVEVPFEAEFSVWLLVANDDATNGDMPALGSTSAFEDEERAEAGDGSYRAEDALDRVDGSAVTRSTSLPFLVVAFEASLL